MRRWPAPLVVLAMMFGCTERADFTDASTSDSGPDTPIVCGSFSEGLSCADAGPDDAGECPSPEGIFTLDARFAIGYSVVENDRSEPMDGACMTPTYTCVASPSPHWEVSWATE